MKFKDPFSRPLSDTLIAYYGFSVDLFLCGAWMFIQKLKKFYNFNITLYLDLTIF